MTELVKQRSMLVILIAAGTSARTAYEAADNLIDADLLADLSKMVVRSEPNSRSSPARSTVRAT